MRRTCGDAEKDRSKTGSGDRWPSDFRIRGSSPLRFSPVHSRYRSVDSQSGFVEWPRFTSRCFTSRSFAPRRCDRRWRTCDGPKHARPLAGRIFPQDGVFAAIHRRLGRRQAAERFGSSEACGDGSIASRIGRDSPAQRSRGMDANAQPGIRGANADPNPRTRGVGSPLADDLPNQCERRELSAL